MNQYVCLSKLYLFKYRICCFTSLRLTIYSITEGQIKKSNKNKIYKYINSIIEEDEAKLFVNMFKLFGRNKNRFMLTIQVENL